ncbi:TPA: type II toxin-antitoxin system HicB family antitoxin [Aeromonas hydrophila]|uniref:type II toxin-antitoxin system HicB family antitoxin n=1 Tax=Aeromonas hydrophila TaxID=644 RepID=UPI0040556B29
MSNNKLMSHNGYHGSIEFDLESGVLFGKIECINDLVTYEATSIRELEAEFIEAVNDYIDMCQQIGKSPDKPMSGSFNIRVGEITHKRLYLAATNKGVSLNEYIKTTLEKHIERIEDKYKDKHIHMHFHSEQFTSYTGKALDIESLSRIGSSLSRGSTSSTWGRH